MNTSQVIETLRNYLANQSDIQHWLGVSTAANALKQILYKDCQYVSVDGNYKFPVIALKFDDDADTLLAASNNVVLELGIVHTVKGANPMHTCLRLKDHIKDALINKNNNDRKQDDINAQGQSLGFDPKIRGLFWVSAITYDDKEQGSERLHRIGCMVRLVVGD